MHDPSTWSPSPSSREPGLLGFRLRSGSGEDLGVIVGVENDREGRPKKLAFLEDGARSPRYVPLRYVRGIDGGVVQLAGPREGYHITRVMRDPEEED
jgi:hypothetical protein